MVSRLGQRLILPAGMVLLFALSVAFHVWDTSRLPAPRIVTPVPSLSPYASTPTVPAPTTITFACDDIDAVYKDYAKLARQFEAQNPGIRVEVKSFWDLVGATIYSDDYQLKMQEIAARADVFCVWDVAPLAKTYYLYDLTLLAANDRDFHSEDFYKEVLETGRYNGRLYAVPGRFQPALVRYDPAAFVEAGLAYPRAGWTWNEFAADAAALTERNDGSTLRWGFAEDAPVVFAARLLAAMEDRALAPSGEGSNPLANEAAVDLFHWYDHLYLQERAAPAPISFAIPTVNHVPAHLGPADVAQRKAAMWTDLMYENDQRRGKPAPLPSDGRSGGSTPFFMGSAWAIAGETLHPEAAWMWLSYLSKNPPPVPRHSGLHARRSLLEQSQFWRDLPPEERDVYRYILNHLMPLTASKPAAGTQVLYRDIVALVAGRIYVGQSRGQIQPLDEIGTGQ